MDSRESPERTDTNDAVHPDARGLLEDSPFVLALGDPGQRPALRGGDAVLLVDVHKFIVL